MKFHYITIEREYVSGGQEIARRLAETAGISCYGREIIQAVSQSQNISESQIDNYEETVTNSFLYTIFSLGKMQSGDTDMLSKEGHIFVAEQEAIRQMANAGSAVFIGHCASEALKDRQGVLRVFIRSDVEEKKRCIINEYGVAENKVEDTMRRFDRKRTNYYYANTAKKWIEFSNYDVVLNSGTIGIRWLRFCFERLFIETQCAKCTT